MATFRNGFSACDADCPHWSLRARTATMHGGYFVRVSDVFFKVGNVPIFYLPKMAFPIQNNTRTGFLIPKFFIDYDNGFGFKQEYYMKFGRRCDATSGIDWRRKRGLVLSQEFRWGRSPWCFTRANMQYAWAKNSLIFKKGKITKGTKHRYWIAAKDFQSWGSVLGGELDSLLFLDFGTDKRIGYQFFNSVDDVDDSFYNAFMLRLSKPSSQWVFDVDHHAISRKRFSNLTNDDKKEIADVVAQVENLGDTVDTQATSVWQKKVLENKVFISKVPHLEWNATKLFFGGNFYLHQTAFIDQVLMRQSEKQQLYYHSFIAQEDKLIPLTVADLVRMDYHSSYGSIVSAYGHSLNLEICPQLQVRNLTKKRHVISGQVLERPLFARGAWRLLTSCSAQWNLPEFVANSYDATYAHVLQPVVQWDFVPKFDQHHWYHADAWDRIFAQHSLQLELRNSWLLHNVQAYCNLAQGYDFFDKKHIHPLRRSLKNNHITPLSIDAGFVAHTMQLSCQQEYDINYGSLLHSMVQAQCKIKNLSFKLGYLYQHKGICKERELLSNVPHFLFVDASLSLGKHIKLSYGGQLYSESGNKFLGFSNIKPLLHGVRFEYTGHCWGVYLGYEEKRYREFGNNRCDRAIVFSLRLDTLGSFAKKFKRPEVIFDLPGESNAVTK